MSNFSHYTAERILRDGLAMAKDRERPAGDDVIAALTEALAACRRGEDLHRFLCQPDVRAV